MWGWYNIVSIWGLELLAWVLGCGIDFLGFGLWLVLWLGGGVGCCGISVLGG